MKGLFPQFDPARSRDFRKIWAEAIFVFDTNVWLNLYRYQSETRDQLLAVLERIKNRVWIPHYAAIEFQRNRIRVMASQGSKFSEVRSVIVKVQSKFKSDLEELKIDRRHALIDTSKLVSSIDRVVSDYLNSLEELEKKQAQLHANDPLKVRIEECLDGKVGVAPSDQKSLDAAYERARGRFERKIPPGYMDRDKDKNEPDDFMHNGLVYKRKYGDYLIWEQILSYAKSQKIKRLVFVTDDAKEDWWWKESLGGPKTLGPRPELVEEAQLLGGIEDFLMYPPDRFLEFSKDFLKVEVTDGALADVRDVSNERVHSALSRRFSSIYGRAVSKWLASMFPNLQFVGEPVVKFVARSGGRKFGFGVNEAAVTQLSFSSVLQKIREAAGYVDASDLDMLTLVWVARSSGGAFDMLSQLRKLPPFANPKRIRHVVGSLLEQSDGTVTFFPVAEWSYGEEVDYLFGKDQWEVDGEANADGE